MVDYCWRSSLVVLVNYGEGAWILIMFWYRFRREECHVTEKLEGAYSQESWISRKSAWTSM